MGIFSSETFDNLNDLFVAQLKDLYDAEHQIAEALPKMEEKAINPSLKSAFRSHLAETKSHITRLEEVFAFVGVDPERQTCDACKGLIKEGNHIISADGDPHVLDVGLILAAQRVEHYEIAGYGGAKAIAERLGLPQAAALLDVILEEEKAADKKLTIIAEGAVNQQAANM